MSHVKGGRGGNQIETIPLKSIEHCTLSNLTNIHLMTFNIDVAPSGIRTGISLICDYLINCKICYVTLGRGYLRNVTTCDKDGGGVKE